MKFESHLYLFKLKLFLYVSLLTTMEYVGTGDKIVFFFKLE